MLQAWIVSPRESLYFAAEATPCNVAKLRTHVQRMRRRLRGRLHLTLNLGSSGGGAGAPGISALRREFTSAQVRVTVESSGSSARLAAARSGARWGAFGRAANQSTGARHGRDGLAAGRRR